MSEFREAVAAWLEGFRQEKERVLREYDHLETRGKEHFTVYVRELLVPAEGGTVAQVYEARRAPYGSADRGPPERTETRRLSERAFLDAVASEAHLRALLALPAPSEREHRERVLERLREGERFCVAGADDGGGHSGRFLTGERTELRREGEGFVLERVSFEDGPSGHRETVHPPLRYHAESLLAALESDAALRSLAGLPPR